MYGCTAGSSRSGTPGQQRRRDALDHRDQVVARERPPRDPPQIELVRLADVQAIDRVAPVGQAGARHNNVFVARRRDHAQRARNHRGRLRPQQQLRRQVARVARVARRTVGRVAEIIVVVGDRNERRRAMHDDRTIPRGAQGIERVLHEQLHRMRAERCVGQIAQRQQAAVGV